jgi:dihydroflavonol-4-reductase
MIVVTGATGLVGSHLCLQLAELEISVKACYHEENKKQHLINLFQYYGKTQLLERIHWEKLDLSDFENTLEITENATCVFHCAAVVSYHPKDAQLLMETNVEGTANMVNSCIENSVDHFIYVSSISALGKNTKGNTTEETPRDMALYYTNYSRSKYLAELEVWRGVEEGLGCTIFNPGVILGPGVFTQSSGTLFQRIAKGLPALPSGGTGLVGVHDVIHALIAAYQTGASNDRYILVSENWSMANLFSTIAQAMGVKIGKTIAKKWQLNLVYFLERVAEIFTGKKASVTQEIIRNYGESNSYNGDKATAFFHFQYSSLREVIDETIAYRNKTASFK